MSTAIPAADSRPEWADPIINDVLHRIEAHGYAGYDPYDILLSRIPIKRMGTLVAAIATQLHKRNPINLRPLLGIPAAVNPKAVGLLLDAVSGLQRNFPDRDYSSTLTTLLQLAKANVSKGYKGAGWGYNFGWASPGKYLPPFAPSGVVTSFVAKGLYAYYELTKDPGARSLLLDAAEFVRHELPVTVDASGSAISYTPFKADVCYNASLLAADTLARSYSLTGDETCRSMSVSAAEYVIVRQHPDGRWNYSLDPVSGVERRQVDFHQGYILDSLQSIARLTGQMPQGAEVAVEKGLEFYSCKQFTPEGRSLWRYPRRYPVDIHNQSQGIITFARTGRPDLVRFAETIARWTIAHMYEPGSGSFHYRKYPLFDNRIPYIRWSNAWMLLALVELRSSLSGLNR